MEDRTFIAEAAGVRKNTNIRESEALHAINIEQKLLIFLYITTPSVSYQNAAEMFHHSLDTISKVFHEVLESLCVLYEYYVKLPESPMEYSKKALGSNPHYWPFFKGCIGALDGTHLPISIPLNQQSLDVGSILGVQYHLKEWEKANSQPVNASELYNLRHASLRGVVNEEETRETAGIQQEGSDEMMKKRDNIAAQMWRQYNQDKDLRYLDLEKAKESCYNHNHLLPNDCQAVHQPNDTFVIAVVCFQTPFFGVNERIEHGKLHGRGPIGSNSGGTPGSLGGSLGVWPGGLAVQPGGRRGWKFQLLHVRWNGMIIIIIKTMGKGGNIEGLRRQKANIHFLSRMLFEMEVDNASPVSVRATSFQGCTHGTYYISVWWWKVAVRSIRLVKINCKVPVVFMDDKVDTFAATVIEIATQHTLQRAFLSITHLHKTTALSPWLLDTFRAWWLHLVAFDSDEDKGSGTCWLSLDTMGRALNL
ncbi:predicted protein [Histoplasma mississippiense (nom. inval.)]|uniref:predicted protein n=1 Tax=Ajellomyces capsulatus (strain NAm1 / WU24) TaxID=2059318 RepID=UPI000157BD76|nr:predicted protein [Histoplasma mississippiense (nom. inval.)]EDN06281.1 predicted protein [Histoplasma mississippiense (nom. inval.)]